MLKSECLVTVLKIQLLGKELSFFICNCSLKTLSERFALTKKSVTNSLSTRKYDINGIFELLTIIFKTDQ